MRLHRYHVVSVSKFSDRPITDLGPVFSRCIDCVFTVLMYLLSADVRSVSAVRLYVSLNRSARILTMN
jgi:hypothetical protein